MEKLFIFGLLTITLVLGEEDGSFIFSSDNLEVKENGKAQLECGIKGDYRYCVWEHGNDIFQVEEVHEDKYPGKSKPRGTWNNQYNQCGIVLENVFQEDFGTWTCKIFIKGGSHVGSKDVVLKSEKAKVTTLATTRKPVTFTKNENTATPKVGANAEESGISGGDIAGIVIAGISLVVIVAGLIVLYIYKKKKLCFSEYSAAKQSDTDKAENKT